MGYLSVAKSVIPGQVHGRFNSTDFMSFSLLMCSLPITVRQKQKDGIPLSTIE